MVSDHRRWRWAPLLLTLLCAACAPGPLKLPTGAGTPASDAADILREATEACGRLTSMTAEVAVSGSVGGRRLRARLLAGLAAPESARLEAVAPFGPPLFVFVARDADATLLLPRDRRVLEHGRPQAVLEAVTGVPLDAGQLRSALTACPRSPRAAEGRQIGEDWRVVPDASGEVYLRRDGRAGPWRVAAFTRQSPPASTWRSEYGEYQRSGGAAGLPASVRLISSDSRRFDLRLRLTQVDINTGLDANAFRVQLPTDVQPLSLEELQRSGPLSSAAGDK